MQPISYRPEIDGLRALAILPVILFHLRDDLLPNGYLGVDVFFVISGFLITSQILAGDRTGGFSFREFYLRRVRRLFPAMAAVLAAVLAYGAVFQEPVTLRSYAAQAIAVLLLVGNHKMRAQADNYWGEQAEDVPLLHTWSLAVEEQFYLLFPVLLLLALRLFRRPRAARLGLLVAVASFALQAYWRWRDPGAAFYLLPARAWELLAGCLLALRQEHHAAARQQRGGEGWAGAGASLIVGSYILKFPGAAGAALAPLGAVAGAVLVIAFSTSTGRLTRQVLSFPPVVFVGKISYSLYLWHWPVIVFCRQRTDAPYFSVPSEFALPVMVGLLSGLALLSYFLIERPLRSWKATPPLSLGAAAALLAAAVTLRTRDPAPSLGADPRPPEFVPVVVHGHRYTLNPEHLDSDIFRTKYVRVKFVPPDRPPSPDLGVVRAGVGTNLDVVMLGNSHAMVVAPAVDQILVAHRLAGLFLIADGVSPRLDRIPGQPELGMTAALLERYDRRRLEVLAQRPTVCLLAMRYDAERFESYRQTLETIVAHSHLVFVQQPPVLNIGDNATVESLPALWHWRKSFANLNIRERRAQTEARHGFERELLAHFQGHPRFHFFPTESVFLQPDGRVRWWDGQSTLWYFDDDHLTEEGVAQFRPQLERLLVDLCAARRQPPGR